MHVSAFGQDMYLFNFCFIIIDIAKNGPVRSLARHLRMKFTTFTKFTHPVKGGSLQCSPVRKSNFGLRLLSYCASSWQNRIICDAELNVFEKALELHLPKFDRRLSTVRTHYKRVLAHVTLPDDQELAALDKLIAMIERGKYTPEN